MAGLVLRSRGRVLIAVLAIFAVSVHDVRKTSFQKRCPAPVKEELGRGCGNGRGQVPQVKRSQSCSGRRHESEVHTNPPDAP